MPLMGLDKLISQMRAKAAKATQDADCSVAVGYTAAYAIYVHENLEMKLRGQPRPLTKAGGSQGDYWDPPGRGQSKFLEDPFRQNRREYAAIVRDEVRKGRTLAQAMVAAGLQLQRDSQLLVPVHYGVLKASAFTRLEVPAQ